MKRWSKQLALSALVALLACCGTEAPEPAVGAVSGRREITLLAVGDLMVHGIQLEYAHNGDRYDFRESFAWVEADLKAADITVGNLETVLGGELEGYSDFPRFNTPDSFGTALSEAGFDLLTTANNHCMDQGVEGVCRTLDVLDALGISHTGTYRSAGEREAVCVLQVEGVTVAFISCTFGTNGIPAPVGREYLVSLMERGQVLALLRRAEALEPDFIVVMPHMGLEYADKPGAEELEWVDFLIANGADIILAAHPHVLQPVEMRQSGGRQALVAYSLGNFLSSQREAPCDIGMMLKLRLVKEEGEAWLEEASVIPTWVQMGAGGQRIARVLPLYDALQEYGERNRFRISGQDAERLQRAGMEVAALLLGGKTPPQREYVLYSGGAVDC